MNRKLLKVFAVVASVAVLAACGTPSKKGDKYRLMTATELLDEGTKNLQGSNYEISVKHFDMIESRFPYSRLAEQAKLNKIYAHYHDRQNDKAMEEIGAFLELYPNHPHADYVWYMAGIINYDRARSIVDKMLPPDRAKVDQRQLRKSLEAFLVVVQEYPDGPYAEDAAQRIIHLRNLLAQAELNIANFYFERDAYVGAANRAQYIIDNYDETPVLSDALYLQVKAYRALGLDELATKSYRLFEHNFPYDPRLQEL